MADAAAPKPGKVINMNLTGDKLHRYETLRGIYEGEGEARDARRQALLEAMDPEDRALFAGSDSKSQPLSYAEFFDRVMQDALAHQDALADAEEAAAEPGE